MSTNSYIVSIARILMAQQKRLAVAESCTSGQIAGRLGYQAGASAWFTGGIIAYSNEVKRKLLKVPVTLLATYGAVSQQCAYAMSEGLLALNLGADIALATTGIAGPRGGSTDKPVGMVCFSLLLPNEPICIRTKYFKGPRQSIQNQACDYALMMLFTKLSKQSLLV